MGSRSQYVSNKGVRLVDIYSLCINSVKQRCSLLASRSIRNHNLFQRPSPLPFVKCDRDGEMNVQFTLLDTPARCYAITAASPAPTINNNYNDRANKPRSYHGTGHLGRIVRPALIRRRRRCALPTTERPARAVEILGKLLVILERPLPQYADQIVSTQHLLGQ